MKPWAEQFKEGEYCGGFFIAFIYSGLLGCVHSFTAGLSLHLHSLHRGADHKHHSFQPKPTEQLHLQQMGVKWLTQGHTDDRQAAGGQLLSFPSVFPHSITQTHSDCMFVFP